MISVGRIKRQRPFTSAAGLPETGRIGVRRPALAAVGTGVFRRGTPARRRFGSIKRCKLRKLISLMERRFWSRLAPTGPRSCSRVFFFLPEGIFFYFFPLHPYFLPPTTTKIYVVSPAWLRGKNQGLATPQQCRPRKKGPANS